MTNGVRSPLKLSSIYSPLGLPSLALLRVTSRTGRGVYASSDTLYKGAIFGRDSLEVAEDIMYIKPRLVLNILRTLASLQGISYDKTREEEPGKIVHEYRNIVVDGRPIDDVSMSIFRELASKWGGNEHEMAYFGSIDATPHFLRVLGKYCAFKGDKILNQTVTLRDGNQVTIRQVADSAAEWVLRKISESRSGLIEYHRQNPHGIANQVWKDSEEFYVHPNGQLANHELPIASIEVQALAYDGLLAAASLLENGQRYIVAAKTLRHTTLKKLWLPKRGYFALGVDYDGNARARNITTLAANQAALLDSNIFDQLPERENRKYISAIVEVIMSHEFLTDAGIRSRALSGAELVDHWDYHGTFVSWTKESYDIAKGLRRQGFPMLARQIENRILNICLSYKAYPEFVYVDKKGRVLASPPSSHSHGEFMLVEGTNKPEHVQAWTVSAVVAIVSSRLKKRLGIEKSPVQEQWQHDLEKKILAHLPYVDRHINPAALRARYPAYTYKLRQKRQ